MNETLDARPDGRLRSDAETAPPDMLDVLVVGGGPAGTAAAFRAKELGLSALVIELDDVLKRIRDYDRDKPIKPDFGAGKQMGFPKGGELIEKLHFFTDVRGADLSEAWKALYRRHGVPLQTGVELVGLEPGGGGAWRALARDHRTGQDRVLCARHVVLALGAGMPRRLDVPGDVRAINHRLSTAGRYVGAPACVIGGGVSAVEAVVAISDAKAAAGDDTAVYWSHRGREMPKAPRALEASMARATSVNRNVKFLPGSEACEVAASESGRILRVLVEQRQGPEEPAARTVLEFGASRAVACIGQEIDWKLMNGMGIFQVAGGPHVRKAIPLNALLESRRPNVYVIGDTLNPAYLECDDFDGDVSAFLKVAHRGNIKASLTDGVKVADVIAQRLAAKSEIRVALEFTGTGVLAAPTAGGTPSAALVRLLDGAVEAEQFVLHPERATTIGRRGSDICFNDDSALADRHAAIVPDGAAYRIRGEDSSNSVFLHLTDGRERAVEPGTVARMGRQWLVLGSMRNPWLVAHHDSNGRLVARHQLSEGTHVLGRDAPDITLTADDESLSRRHASVVVVGASLFVRDLNSVNGVYLKVDGSWGLSDGDVVRVGGQALRFSLLGAEPGAESRPVACPSVSRPAVVEPSAEALTVTFSNRGQRCPFERGQTICEAAEAGGVEISADCHAGICGSDPVRVVSGGDRLNPMSGAERETLEDICAVAPETHRLACMARPTGPVVVEIVDG